MTVRTTKVILNRFAYITNMILIKLIFDRLDHLLIFLFLQISINLMLNLTMYY